MASLLGVFPVKPFVYGFGCDFSYAGDGGEFFYLCFSYSGDGFEFFQQSCFSGFAHAGALVEFAFLYASAEQDFVIDIGEAVRFVTDALE